LLRRKSRRVSQDVQGRSGWLFIEMGAIRKRFTMASLCAITILLSNEIAVSFNSFHARVPYEFTLNGISGLF
jgi:hypothetical protein